ncbi:armadillo repeat protein [Ophiocordyceps camponoti-floridani]|uniref:Armadillo repeat protein n=1 Tax=Ophiocordyceps camponoti-floridani TaxID=2030778 RepID=A0A8H4QC84_9HYPO|nr:armadillo repeat protein [Ophiocordyceps camponoti-floridani]
MARSQDSSILALLLSAKSYAEQAAALRLLKDQVVGHIQKKEAWVALGVLDPIVSTLSNSSSRFNGKDARSQLATRPLSEEETVRLQALQLIASFACGGPAFLEPLFAARAVPAILANSFSPHVNAPQIVVAASRALTEIARAADLASPGSPLDVQSLADSLFVPEHIESLNVMLSMTSSKHVLQSQPTLAAGLIYRLCRDERHQHALVIAGVLDSLATQLARFAVRDGLVVPGAEELAYSDGLYEVFPEPAVTGAPIGPILEAIAAVLGDSKYRANRLVYSPAILATFPSIKCDPQKGPPGQPSALTAMEHLLPPMPVSFPRSQSVSNLCASQPPDRSAVSRSSSRVSLSKFGTAAIWESPRAQTQGDGTAEDVESPLIPWLLYLVRTLAGYELLMAANVLAALFKAGLGRKSVRETSIGLLVIPILVGILTRDDEKAKKKDKDKEPESVDEPEEQLIVEKVPAILARFITDSDYLQKATYDCGAVKVLSKLLKRAYQPVPHMDRPKYWSPEPTAVAEPQSSSASARLGEGGQNALLVHHVKLREATLRAIGALSAGNEDYRKALVADDLVPCVVESLWKFPRKPRQAKERPKDRAAEPVRRGPSAAYGTNTVSVIVAGCHVVRMLARSVSILRTALVDNSIALPIFYFLRHDDVNVQIAATATVINLVVEVSPVRELLTELGVMRILCEHAHSANPALRLNALWALKHFVDAVGPELKKASLETLEAEWLVQLICDDSHDARFRETSGHADDGDADMDMLPPEQPLRWLYGANGSVRELDASRSTRLRQAEDRLTTLLETEFNPARRARSNDVAIQEQGLDFIRNLIGRPGSGVSSETPSETTEMIDFLLGELGQKRLFDILASKLRPKKVHSLPLPRRTATGTMSGREAARVMHPQARIIVAVTYILVHMAASVPRHRQLVVEQTDLLKLLAQQSSSKEREVRVALCHLIINLTWQEDGGEGPQCLSRVLELRRLGFQNKMDTLKHQDCDLDVRERAKTAAWQMEQASSASSY